MSSVLEKWIHWVRFVNIFQSNANRWHQKSEIRHQIRLYYSLVFPLPVHTYLLTICIASRYLQLYTIPSFSIFNFQFTILFDSQFPILNSDHISADASAYFVQASTSVWKTVFTLILHPDCHSNESIVYSYKVIIALKIQVSAAIRAPCWTYS